LGGKRRVGGLAKFRYAKKKTRKSRKKAERKAISRSQKHREREIEGVRKGEPRREGSRALLKRLVGEKNLWIDVGKGCSGQKEDSKTGSTRSRARKKIVHERCRNREKNFFGVVGPEEGTRMDQRRDLGFKTGKGCSSKGPQGENPMGDLSRKFRAGSPLGEA